MIALYTLWACGSQDAPLPEGSLYVASVPLEGRNGEPLPLGVHRGHPTLVTMAYTSCQYVCPMLVTELQAVEGSLDEAHRADLRVLVISLDPARDTPAALREFARSHGVDRPGWTFARPASEADVRTLAALLDIRFRPMPNGEFDHSATLVLLDRDGRPIHRVDGAKAPIDDLVHAIQTEGGQP